MPLQNLILSILPLSLAAAVSPMLFSESIVILSSKYCSRRKIIDFLLGVALVALTIGLLEITAAGKLIIPGEEIRSSFSSYIDLGLGTFLLFLGVRRIYNPIRHKKDYPPEENTTPQDRKFFLFGMFSMATNFTTFIFYLAALKTISLDAESLPNQLIALTFINFFILLPVTIPILITVIAPERSGEILGKAGVYLEKNGNVATIAVLFFFGIYLVLRSLKTLI